MRTVESLFHFFEATHNMPKQKAKRKGNVSFLESIGPALLPAAALTAVPWCPGPQFPGGNPLSLALVAFPRTEKAGQPSGLDPGALGEPSGTHTTGPSSSGASTAAAAGDINDDSFDEDDDIEEAGYTTVAQALGTGGNRQSYSDRGRVPTPPSQRNVATTSHVTNMAGEIYHILEPEEGEPADTDIYALPNKGKGVGKRTIGQEEEGDTSMDRMQQDMRKAMQAVPDTPVEETMLRLSEGRQATGSSSGRGTMWRESEFSATPRDVPSLPLEHTPSPVPAEVIPPPAPAPAPVQQQVDTPSTTRKKKKLLKKREKEKGEKQSAHQQEVVVGGGGAEKQRKMAASAPAVRTGGSGSKPQHTTTPTTQASTPKQRAAVTTPRQPATSSLPSPSPSLKREMQQVREKNQKLQNEIAGLRKMAAAIGAGSDRGASSRRSSQMSEELKGENETLKKAVGRLNQELSRYQAAFRPLSTDDQSRLQALPNKGPVPSWLINKRYLSPLFLAYDDLIQEKEEVIRRCQAQLQALKNRTEEVVRENQQYERRMSGNVAIIAASDWQSLQEQARLVLEENQVLTEQVQLQHSKVKDMTSTHMHQVSRLTQRLADCEEEREETERQLEDMRAKLREVKHKHDRLQLEAVKKTSLYEHVNSVADMHRSAIDEEQQSQQEKEEMLLKLKACEQERERQALALVEARAENQQLKAELSAMQHAVRRSQNKLLLLQKAIRLSESKEQVTQNELANVIKMVEKTALERDTAFRVAKEQQRDCKSTVNRIADSGVIMSKMEEKLQTYKLRASAKLQTVADKLKEQDDLFNSQRQEYEREIVYLRQLLRDKEKRIGQLKGEQKDMEESLETVWQASRAENQRLRETLVDSDNRLHRHPSLHAQLLEQDDMERLLTFD